MKALYKGMTELEMIEQDYNRVYNKIRKHIRHGKLLKYRNIFKCIDNNRGYNTRIIKTNGVRILDGQ